MQAADCIQPQGPCYVSRGLAAVLRPLGGRAVSCRRGCGHADALPFGDLHRQEQYTCLWEQMKSVRQDLTVQRIPIPRAFLVGTDARHARFRGPRPLHLRHAQTQPRHLRPLGTRERGARR